MSGISYPPPTPSTPWSEFNTLQFNIGNSNVTLNYLQANYLNLSGGTMTGNLNTINITNSGNLTMGNSSNLIIDGSLTLGSTSVTATGVQLNYLSGVSSLGTAYASSVLTVDSNKNLTGLGALTIGTTTSGSGTQVLKIHTNDNTTAGTITVTGGTSSVVSTQLQFNTNSCSWGTNSDHVFNLMTNNENALTIATNSYIGLGTSPNYLLDFGAQNADVLLCLSQNGTSNGLYGLGANTSTSLTELHSAGGFAYFNGTTQSTLGTNVATISSTGNINATSGLFTGFTSTITGPSSTGVKIHYGNSLGAVFCYNYASNTALPMEFGYTSGGNYHLVLTQTSSNAWTNMNTTSTSGIAPLYVAGSSNQSETNANWGYLQSTGAGNTVLGSFSNRAFSCVMDYGILISSGQINVFSDIRLKSNINDLDPDETMRFINTINPISFQYKESHTEDKSIYYGYSAQSLVANLFPNLVGFTDIQNQESNILENLELQDNLDIECIDGSTIHLQKNQKLVVDLQKMVPILHKAIQLILKRVCLLEKK